MADTTPEQLQELMRVFDEGTLAEMRHLLRTLSPQDIANLLESSPPRLRNVVWELVPDRDDGAVLQYLGDDVRADFLKDMDTAELLAVAGDIDTDDFVDILQQLPDTITRRVLDSMDADNRARVEQALSFPEDSAGGLMDTEFITIRASNTLSVVLRYLRRHETLPPSTDALFVVNAKGEYVGRLPLARLLTTDPSVTVREVMTSDLEPFPAVMSDVEVARIFTDRDLVSAPVVGEDGQLLGRITIDDVVDVIIEDAEDAFLGRAGLDADEDTFAPVLRSARRRAVWLGINLATAFLASAVINIFEDTIAKVVALAILMPIVASMGGIAGTQTLTLVVRGMALGHIGRSNLWWLVNRELIVGLINGVVWAIVVAIGAATVFSDITLGLVIGFAMVINMVIAAVCGALLPQILQALKIDPAVAGGVVLTTITDVTGFMIFLGMATAVYA